MKRLIYLTAVLMIGFICFGCSGMSAEHKDGRYDHQPSHYKPSSSSVIYPWTGGSYCSMCGR